MGLCRRWSLEAVLVIGATAMSPWNKKTWEVEWKLKVLLTVINSLLINLNLVVLPASSAMKKDTSLVIVPKLDLVLLVLEVEPVSNVVKKATWAGNVLRMLEEVVVNREVEPALNATKKVIWVEIVLKLELVVVAVEIVLVLSVVKKATCLENAPKEVVVVEATEHASSATKKAIKLVTALLLTKVILIPTSALSSTKETMLLEVQTLLGEIPVEKMSASKLMAGVPTINNNPLPKAEVVVGELNSLQTQVNL
jgi:hypothetical protein